MKKYLVQVEFRYNIKTEDEEGLSYQTKKTAIAICETYEQAMQKGNEALEVFERHFKLKRKERFAYNRNLITEIGYLQTPFCFFASIITLEFFELEKKLIELKQIAI